MLISFKKFYEVAAIVKSAVISDGSDRGVGSAKHGTSVFYTVVIQIVHRRPMGDSLEISAKIFRGHPGDLRKLLQADAGRIMAFNIFKDRFQLFHVPERGFKAGCAASIIFFLEDKAEQREKRADDGKFKAGSGFGHGSE